MFSFGGHETGEIETTWFELLEEALCYPHNKFSFGKDNTREIK